MWTKRIAMFVFLIIIFCLKFSRASQEQRGNEMLEKAKLNLWELMKDENFREMASKCLIFVDKLVKNAYSSKILAGITEEIAEILINENSSHSATIIVHGLRIFLQQEKSPFLIDSILKNFKDVVVHPELVKMLKKKYGLATALAEINNGSEVIKTLADNLVKIMSREDPKNDSIKAFTNLEYIIKEKTLSKAWRFMYKGSSQKSKNNT